jgi:deazaflavin-dependent oxidoreductase (nitroreductase family)
MDRTKIEKALQTDRLVDITTTGRRSGEPHRIEIGFHYLDGKVYISGLPGRRDWYANLRADPAMTMHFKLTLQADVTGRAVPIEDEASRRPLLERITARWNRKDQLEQFIADSPLIEVRLDAETG